MKMHFNKPFKSIQEQIQLLRDRGLIIDDDAEHYLRHLNYYRLSGYWIPFEKNHSEHVFETNTHFNDILNLYIFDRELRLILLDAIERLEVSVRTHWAHYCAEDYGAHAHTNDRISRNTNWHDKNLSLLTKEIERSEELFIKHYHNRYKHPQTPPIWAVCEVMSLGLLSRWIKDLKPTETRKKIALSFQLDYNVLASFIEHATYLRNLCAHHSRVWNRKATKTMQIPSTKPSLLISSFNHDPHALRKIYNTLVMLIHLINIISPANHLKTRLIDLIAKHKINVISMGFPGDWERHDIWKS